MTAANLLLSLFQWGTYQTKKAESETLEISRLPSSSCVNWSMLPLASSPLPTWQVMWHFFFYWEGWDKQESCQRVTCHNTRVLQRGECTWLVYLVERIVSFTSQMDLQWKSWVYTATVHTEASLDSVRALRASTRRGILHQCLSP